MVVTRVPIQGSHSVDWRVLVANPYDRTIEIGRQVRFRALLRLEAHFIQVAPKEIAEILIVTRQDPDPDGNLMLCPSFECDRQLGLAKYLPVGVFKNGRQLPSEM